MPVPAITNYIKRYGEKSLIAKVAFKVMNKKADLIYKKIKSDLNGKKILDIGAGIGSISNILAGHNYKVTSIDVTDLNIYKDVHVIVYDGEQIPYENKKFDTAIIIHVLHHCNDKEKVLREAMRVSKKVIFIEDTFYNVFDLVFLQIQDALTNFEFRIHDFESVKGWKKIINSNGWTIISIEKWSEFLITSFYSKYVKFVVKD